MKFITNESRFIQVQNVLISSLKVGKPFKIKIKSINQSINQSHVISSTYTQSVELVTESVHGVAVLRELSVDAVRVAHGRIRLIDAFHLHQGIACVCLLHHLGIQRVQALFDLPLTLLRRQLRIIFPDNLFCLKKHKEQTSKFSCFHQFDNTKNQFYRYNPIQSNSIDRSINQSKKTDEYLRGDRKNSNQRFPLFLVGLGQSADASRAYGWVVVVKCPAVDAVSVLQIVEGNIRWMIKAGFVSLYNDLAVLKTEEKMLQHLFTSSTGTNAENDQKKISVNQSNERGETIDGRITWVKIVNKALHLQYFS